MYSLALYNCRYIFFLLTSSECAGTQIPFITTELTLGRNNIVLTWLITHVVFQLLNWKSVLNKAYYIFSSTGL